MLWPIGATDPASFARLGPRRHLRNLELLVHRMGAAAWAELLDLELLRLLLAILGRVVIASLAAVACKPDDFSYCRHVVNLAC